MEAIAAEQSRLGKAIEQMLVNFKKDSTSRKTFEYLQKRLDRLEEDWNNFNKNDQVLDRFEAENQEHPYFGSNYYIQVEMAYNQLKLKIKEATDQLREQPLLTSGEQSPKEHISKVIGEEAQIGDDNGDDNSELARLVRKQKATMATLVHHLRDIESKASEGHPRAYYEVKMKLINDYWSNVSANNQQIWENSQERKPYGYESKFYMDIEVWIQDTLVCLSQQLESLIPVTSSQGSNTQLKLPKITLPVFDGDYLKWKQFHDLYTQLIHNQPMSNAQKMFYLHSNLAGEANSLIKHLPISDENYASAWELLTSRYNNKRLLVTALLNKLFSQPAVQQESSTAVKLLHDTTNECVLGLKNMGIPIDTWDPILVHIIIKKLDKTTHGLYEQSLNSPRDLQSMSKLLNFLELRFQALEALGKDKQSTVDKGSRQSSSAKSSSFTTTAHNSCIICNQAHAIYSCKEFLQQSPANRLQTLRKNKLCINCMKEGHFASKCTSTSCRKCSKKHNTLVHMEKAKQAASVTTSEGSQRSTDNPVTLSVQHQEGHQQKKRSYVLLSTVRINILDNHGAIVECRALLDSGSQLNFISERLYKRLGFKGIPDLMNISGIGETRHRTQQRLNVTLQSRVTGFSTQLEVFVLPHITSSQPENFINTKTWPMPKNIQLADPEFNQPNRIDCLIGAEIYHQLMSIGQIKLGDELPTLQNTILGWIVTGKVENIQGSSGFCGICTCGDVRIDEQMEKFWRLEEFESSSKKLTQLERKCESMFEETVKRDNKGQFIVELPFLHDPCKLGESKDIAFRRFISLERKLSKNEELRKQYVEFMKEYERCGHMKEIQINKIPKIHYFMPHHSVIKPESSTTKLRVVFDASAKTSTNISLNDILCTGPTIQDELFSILLRFRMPRFVFTADIEKMYRQVKVAEKDRMFQLIVWRDDPRKAVKYYNLCTVTYGTRTAPYLATKCLQRLADDENNQYPLGSRAAKRDFYVDDIMTGSDNLGEAIETQKQLKTLLRSAGFNLRKWCANHPQLLKNIPKEDIELQLDLNDSSEGQVKTLGLTWLPKSDLFCVKTLWSEGTKVTKRTVLADIAHLFDPLGIMNPVIVVAKIFLQELWRLKIDWDAALPMELHTKWIKFRQGLKTLNNITFPRHIMTNQPPRSIQLHTFSDASERAYGAAVYIRITDIHDNITVRLLCAKSRVAPTRVTTLPRLELCAAKVAAQLVHRVKKDLDLQNQSAYYWTDSEIVLAWLQSESSSFQTFVANRIAAIHELTNVQEWRHVSTKTNPADIVSRGISPAKLKGCDLWFNGPRFLQEHESKWSSQNIKFTETDLEKRRLKTTLLSNKNLIHFINAINHRNSFRTLQHVVAYILRFINNLRTRGKQREDGILKVSELDKALAVIIKQMQHEGFKTEILALRKNQQVHNASQLSSLTPFIDERGIVRVGGRLQAAALPYNMKHPMLIPYSHILTRLLMTQLHLEHLHAGPQALLAITRQQFWPIKGKLLARSIVQRCVQCVKAKPKLMSQLMGNLPSTRIQPNRAFVNSGVDFCGPIWTHFKIRGKRPQKSYVAVFCCFSTKAAHLEVVTDLTADGFIGALRRFIGRRGICRNLYCDNATNFIGAKNQLEELQKIFNCQQAKEKISTLCSQKGIDFHFIPPRAPHFGGLWEAAVKSAKHLLHRAVASASLTYEELETVMIEIEAILNSRPLTPLSSDPNDLTALTPGHFIIGEPLTSLVDPIAQPMSSNLIKRWKLISYVKHEFWRRWSKEYLCELQQRHKWKIKCQNAQPGTMVIIKDDNLPPLKWQLGRIIKVIKGEDSLVRVADVKTASGVLSRPIHRLCPLPIEVEADPDTKEEKCQNEASKGHKIIRPNKRSFSNKVKFHPINPNWLRNSSKTEIPEPAPKRSSITGPRTVKTVVSLLLMTCLMLPIKADPAVNITVFSSQPGLYFENLGQTNLVSHEWNLIVYYDMKNYWNEFEGLQRGLVKLTTICDAIDDQQFCTTTLTQFKQHIEEIKNNNELLLSQSKDRKSKRALLNIVGNIAHSLFGVLDSEYAEEMSKTIDNVKTNQGYLLELIKNQTSLIDSTANIMKRSQDDIYKQFEVFDGNFKQIRDHLNTIQQEQQQQRLLQFVTTMSMHIILVTTNYQRIQSALLDVIIDTHHGKINPMVLTPKQLKKEVAYIKDHLPATLKLPGTREHLSQLYNLMTIQSHLAENLIMFRIKIPLFSYEEFEMFRIIPIPVSINSTFMVIKPTSNYLVINLHRDQYYPMTESELSSCAPITDATYMCKQKHPIYRKGANVSQCEHDLINHMPVSPSCTITTAKDTTRWIQLFNPNHWIYVMDKKTTINIVCGSKVSQQILEGSGLLKLKGGCIIRQEWLTINAHNIFPTQLRTSFIPSTNLSDYTLPPILAASPDTHSHQVQQERFNLLQNQIQDLKVNEKFPTTLQPHDVHQFTVGYLALLLLIILVVYIIWKYRRDSRFTKASKSKPRPRPRKTTRPEDFTINIEDSQHVSVEQDSSTRGEC